MVSRSGPSNRGRLGRSTAATAARRACRDYPGVAPARPPGALWDRRDALAPSSADDSDLEGEPEPPHDPGQPPQEQDQPPPGEPVIEVPFEDPENFAFVDGLWTTIKRVLLHPRLFFSTMPANRGSARTLLYFLIISELLALTMFLWVTIGLAGLRSMEEGREAAELLAQLSVYNDPLSLILYPLVATVGLFVRSAVTHLVILLLGGGRGGFEATFRAFAYGTTPYLLAVFPVVGLVVGGLLSIVYTIIGLMHLHRLSAAKATLIYILPIAAWFGLMYLMMSPPTGAA